MTFYAKQKKTYPRTIKIAKIGREWIDVIVILDKGNAKAKLKLDANTKTLAVGTTISAQMSYLSDFGASPVKYAVASNMTVVSVDRDAAENDAATNAAYCVMRKLKMNKKTSGISLLSLSTEESTNRLVNDQHHPATLKETVEVDGKEVTLFDNPTLRKRIAITEFDGKTLIIRAEYEPKKVIRRGATTVSQDQKTPDLVVSPRKKRFLAEAGAQLWDNCPHCGHEPVYTPKMVCENCW